MSPFELRRERLSEVCLLLRRLYNYKPRNTPRGNSKEKPRKNFIKVLDYKKDGG